MNRQMRHSYRRWLLAFVLAGLLVTTTVYVPLMTTPVYACENTGGGGGC